MNVRSHVLLLRRYQSELGIAAGLKWYVIYVANRRRWIARRRVYLKPQFLKNRVAVRLQSSSDVNVFDQIFISKDFAFIDQIKGLRTVVDLGANVGYFSAYVLSTFADAITVAVEPESGNAELCRQNLEAYGSRAQVCEGAVWHSQANLVVSRGTFGDGREWATQVRIAESDEEPDVRGWDMPTLIGMCPFGIIDLLKIDIEGSEEQLFSASNDKWLDHVKNICIEIHEGMNCKLAVARALSSFEYDRAVSGEYTLFMNLRRKC